MRPVHFWHAALLTSALILSGCTSSAEDQAKRQRDADTAAGKAGKAAHGVAVETGKAARVAGRSLAKAAREAHAGWQEAAREDKAKRK